MHTSTLLIENTLTLSIARQRAERTRRHYLAQLSELRATLAAHPQRIRPLAAALGGSRRVARRATALILALGSEGGAALASLLPTMFADIEALAPQDARGLRRADALLCGAITLVERLAPERIADVYRAATAQRGAVGRSPWWTFRPWQRLNEALQRRMAAGDSQAIDAILDTVALGAAAQPGSPAHQRARWAIAQHVAHMPGA